MEAGPQLDLGRSPASPAASMAPSPAGAPSPRTAPARRDEGLKEAAEFGMVSRLGMRGGQLVTTPGVQVITATDFTPPTAT